MSGDVVGGWSSQPWASRGYEQREEEAGFSPRGKTAVVILAAAEREGFCLTSSPANAS